MSNQTNEFMYPSATSSSFLLPYLSSSFSPPSLLILTSFCYLYDPLQMFYVINCEAITFTIMDSVVIGSRTCRAINCRSSQFVVEDVDMRHFECYGYTSLSLSSSSLSLHYSSLLTHFPLFPLVLFQVARQLRCSH